MYSTYIQALTAQYNSGEVINHNNNIFPSVEKTIRKNKSINKMKIRIDTIGRQYLDKMREELGIQTKDTTFIINRAIKHFSDNCIRTQLLPAEHWADNSSLLPPSETAEPIDEIEALTKLSEILNPGERLDINKLLSAAVNTLAQERVPIVELLWNEILETDRIQYKFEPGNDIDDDVIKIKRTAKEVQELRDSLNKRVQLYPVKVKKKYIKAAIWTPVNYRQINNDVNNIDKQKGSNIGMNPKVITKGEGSQRSSSNPLELADGNTGLIEPRLVRWSYTVTPDPALVHLSEKNTYNATCKKTEVPEEPLIKFKIKTKSSAASKRKRPDNPDQPIEPVEKAAKPSPTQQKGSPLCTHKPEPEKNSYLLHNTAESQNFVRPEPVEKREPRPHALCQSSFDSAPDKRRPSSKYQYYLRTIPEDSTQSGLKDKHNDEIQSFSTDLNDIMEILESLPELSEHTSNPVNFAPEASFSESEAIIRIAQNLQRHQPPQLFFSSFSNNQLQIPPHSIQERNYQPYQPNQNHLVPQYQNNRILPPAPSTEHFLCRQNSPSPDIYTFR